MSRLVSLVLSATLLAECSYVPPPAQESPLLVDTARPEDGVRDLPFYDLARRRNLTPEEFTYMMDQVTSFDALRQLIEASGVHYPEKWAMTEQVTTKEFDLAFGISYGSPFETHARGYGLCDELALYVLPGLLNIPTIKEVYLVQVGGMIMRKDTHRREASYHSFVLFRQGKEWGYANNLTIVEEGFASREDAALHVARTIVGYSREVPLTFTQRRVTSLGNWLTDTTEAETIKPEDAIDLR